MLTGVQTLIQSRLVFWEKKTKKLNVLICAVGVVLISHILVVSALYGETTRIIGGHTQDWNSGHAV